MQTLDSSYKLKPHSKIKLAYLVLHYERYKCSKSENKDYRNTSKFSL